VQQAANDKYGAKYPSRLTPPIISRPPAPDTRTKVVRGVFALLAIAAAIAAGIYTYDQSESIWLCIFVGGGVVYIGGRVLPDLITDPKKVRRALYFLLLPGIATGALYLAYQAWETWWLAVVIGWVAAFILNPLLAPRLFPGIHAEEMQDTMDRMKELED
jgi:hypothetical protein